MTKIKKFYYFSLLEYFLKNFKKFNQYKNHKEDMLVNSIFSTFE